MEFSIYFCLWCFLFFRLACGGFFKSNPSDLSLCDVHYSRTGSAYKDFYSVENLYRNSPNASYILDFHFGVMASSDAHILLAPSARVTKLDPVYEVVIGAGGNTFCDIRRMQKSEVKSSVRIGGLLSALDPHFFWIHIANDGLIEVGREGNTTSFISWKDDDPLPIRHFSFSTWSDIEAKWYFNCDRSQDHEELEKKLTPLEKLRRNLLSTYDPIVRPVVEDSVITEVLMRLHIGFIQLNEHKSSMDISGVAKLLWHDEKMHWNPKDYNGIEEIHVFRKEIWHPDLICFNSASEDQKSISEDTMMKVTNTGLVSWNPILDFSVWCDAADLTLWPRDQHTCTMILGCFRDFDRVFLKFDDDNSTLLAHQSSEWLPLNVTLVEHDNGNDTFSGSPVFQLMFLLRRSSTVYSAIFFTPFLVIAATLLLSFWVSPFGYLKIAVSCAGLLLETIMVLAMATFVPVGKKSPPFLLEAYSYSLAGSLLALVLSVIVINFSRNKPRSTLPHFLCNILTSTCMKKALYLPNVVMQDEYGELTNQISSTSRIQDRDQSIWLLLGVVIDRLAFFIYLPLVMFCIGHYVAASF